VGYAVPGWGLVGYREAVDGEQQSGCIAGRCSLSSPTSRWRTTAWPMSRINLVYGTERDTALSGADSDACAGLTLSA
jgi:hypothetical protein